MAVFLVKYNDVDYMLSDEKLDLGDEFVFVNPTDPTQILDRNQTLKHNKIDFRKVVWLHGKAKDVHQARIDLLFTLKDHKSNFL